MFTLTKINLLWDKVKALTAQVDTMAKIPRGSVVVGLMDGSVSISETARNEIGDAFKKNIPCFIVFSFSNTIKNMYRVTQCHYNGLNGELTEIIAIQMKKDAVGHYYIDAKASNSWSAEATSVDGSSYTPPNYSTTEQDTGVKWIDNRPVYRKVVVFDTPFTMSTGSSWQHTSVPFDGELVSCSYYDEDGKQPFPVPCGADNGYLSFYPAWAAIIKYVILEYVKPATNNTTLTRKKTTKKEEE